MALNSLIVAVHRELSCREFTAVVCAEHSELVAALLLCGYLWSLDGICSCRLRIEQHGPHIAGGVIDEK